MNHSNDPRKERRIKKTDKEVRLKDKVPLSNKNRDTFVNTSRFQPNKSSFPALPPLKNVKACDLETAIQEKLLACSIIFSFQENNYLEEKEDKRNTLIEISEYINMAHNPLPDYFYSAIPEMFGCNVFRVLAPFTPFLSLGMEDEDDYQFLDSWPHLQIVYEIMLRFLEKPNFEIRKSKRTLDQVFVKCLLDLFDSSDPRERDYLKTILHRIYGKMVNIRAFIRKQINNIFFTFIYETEKHNGIAELLEILGSIINGFQTPVKDEHKIFLARVLLPLHKMKSLNQYHPQLAYCITEFIKKDRSLIKCVIIDGLIKFWPKMQSFKELMFLNELEECLELCDNKQFDEIMRPLVLQLARCVSSTNFQVCERTLYFWTNAEIVELMTPSIKQILPLIFPSLFTSKHHWNKQIHSMVFNALKIIMDMDPTVFDEYTSQFKDDRNKEKEHIQFQVESWNKIQLKAKKNPLYNRYSESMDFSSLQLDHLNNDDNKSVRNIGAEIKNGISDNENIVKKINLPRSQSAVSLKSIDAKTDQKETYSFKN